MAILEIQHATKRFGGFTAIDQVSLAVEAGSTHAIIGPNGAGKTTLFNLVSGLISPDEGSVRFQGIPLAKMKEHEIVQIGMARSFQKVNVFPRSSCAENVQVALIAHTALKYSPFRDASKLFRSEAEALLDLVNLQADADRRAGELAYGKQKQLELAVALAAEPKMLLLDEPTAGMSIAETKSSIKLIKEIVQKKGLTLLFTEHDMEVVFGIATTISMLHHGKIITTGAPDDVRNNEEVKRIYLGKN
ncbi:ABC transporter ATP-binding protein [Paraburkholderia strydomiana]|uniref:ABC transporter ATP-binding protein n=1 Tax=Paraburkholderia strydomiana TaxID=1245417 RepID=UPI001BE9B9A5|nr:ABC transporter ATP-binding protein [Paraburkholderia strydomiana]MBT2793566.1 ABC transporter ATP-binding protein [Paraburkholderia strydomiana]